MFASMGVKCRNFLFYAYLYHVHRLTEIINWLCACKQGRGRSRSIHIHHNRLHHPVQPVACDESAFVNPL